MSAPSPFPAAAVKPHRTRFAKLSTCRTNVMDSVHRIAAAGLTRTCLAIWPALSVAALGCSDAEFEALPVVARGRYVEIASERDEPICGGTVDYLDRVIEAGFEVLGETPPDRVFVRFEWLAFDEDDPVLGGARATINDETILIRSDVHLVHEHELVHAVHLQAWPRTNRFFYEGLAVLLDAKRIHSSVGWPDDDDLDDVLGPGSLPFEYYQHAWYLVSQIVFDHGFDGLREFWHAVPAGSTAEEVRAAYMSLFGQSIDVLLEPYILDLGPGGTLERPRRAADFALCPAPPSAWQGDAWTASGPTGCEDDPLAIGPDRRSHLAEHGEVWRDATVTLETRFYDTTFGPTVGGFVAPCILDREGVGAGATQVGGMSEGDYMATAGPWRVEVRAALEDLPTTTPGSYTIEVSGE